MMVILDNGHGNPPLTGGKCSPDGKIKEYEWARDVVRRIADKLRIAGIATTILVPEPTDVPLHIRTMRANRICSQLGARNCILISVHINAAGSDGKWHDASGWCGFVAPNASTLSLHLAQYLWEHANRAGLRGNRAVPECRYWVQSLAMCRDTKCPAVLTENMFMDNPHDAVFLQSEAGKNTIAEIHVAAIKQYIKSMS